MKEQIIRWKVILTQLNLMLTLGLHVKVNLGLVCHKYQRNPVYSSVATPQTNSQVTVRLSQALNTRQWHNAKGFDVRPEWKYSGLSPLCPAELVKNLRVNEEGQWALSLHMSVVVYALHHFTASAENAAKAHMRNYTEHHLPSATKSQLRLNKWQNIGFKTSEPFCRITTKM